ncbi:MAG TPA: Ig-like domain repeat protein, partial [Vulgatibacter sp.]
LDSSGVARSSASLPIGDHTITATYNGDANFLASSGSQRFSVDPIATTVSTPVLVSGTPTLGQPLTFSATVSAGGAPATGTLTFRDGSALIGVADLNASGTGTITTSTLGAGAHLITASYSGNVDNAPATSAPLSLTIKAASTTTLTSSLNPSTPGASVSFTATVAGPAGVPTPSGSVSFADGSTPLGTISLNASAQAVLTLASGLAAGDHSIVATYNGDQQFLLSSSAPLVQRVTRPATTTTLAQGIGPAGFFLTSVVSAEHGIPTGAAQFRNVSAGTVLGTAPLVNGVATLPIAAPLPVGQTIQAVYDGDTTFAGSASPQQVFIAAVNGFSFVPGFVPDAIATIFGDGLAPSTAEAPGLPLPTTLAGIEVRIADANGRQYPAMLYYVSPRQINFVVPPAAPLGPARILIVQGETALSISVVITRSAPSLTSADGSGSGTAAAQVIRLHGDGTQDPPESVTAAAIPTAPGDRLFLVLYGTGLRHAGDGFSCALNGQSVPVLFAGA